MQFVTFWADLGRAAGPAAARAAGQASADAWGVAYRDAVRAGWDALGKLAALSAACRDRSGDCLTFARDRGIAVDHD